MNVGDLRGKFREALLKWKAYVRRKKDSYVGKMVPKLHVGKRKRGRPKRRCVNCLKQEMQIVGVKMEDAHNRALRKRKLCTGDPT